MKSLQVIRTHISSYQRPEFTQMEKSRLEAIQGIEYRTINNLDPEKDIVLVTNTHTRLSDLPKSVLNLTRLIVHPNSGYDNFQDDHLLWAAIPVVIGHQIRAQAVAEYTLGCLFEGMLELPQHLFWYKDRKWDRKLLKNQSVHVFGYGHIGKIVADTLKQIGMDVTVIDPFIKQCPHRPCKSWQEAAVERSRAVLVCMSLNSTTKRLLNEDFFSSLSEEVLFINGARGGLVDERALKNYLFKNPRSFAFLDVFENEPFQDEWHNFPQVWKTSHIAGVHKDLDQEILDFEQNIITDFVNLNKSEFNIKYKRELLQNKWIEGELI